MENLVRTTIGLCLMANRAGFDGRAELPEGKFAVVVKSNGAWFAVDMAGNVRGDPEAVEREALSLGAGVLEVSAAVGLARLALRRFK
jgi:hypothetical protein